MTAARARLYLDDIVGVAAGGHHSMALSAQGDVVTWGANFRGQLGRGSFGGATANAAPVPGLGNVRAIAAGNEHSLALLADGTARAWGAK